MPARNPGSTTALAHGIQSQTSLVWWAGRFWGFSGKQYSMNSKDHTEALVRRQINSAYEKMHLDDLERWRQEPQTGQYRRLAPLCRETSQRQVEEVIAELKSQVILPEELYPPCLPKEGKRLNILSVNNGLLWLDGNPPMLTNHSSEVFITSSLPYDYIPGAKCPLWQGLLEETFEGDADSIRFLQEWFGLNLIWDTTCQAFLVLYGVPGTGKTVIGRGLMALLGEKNFSIATPQELNSRFGVEPIIGKLANIVTDLDTMERLDRGIFKRLVDGEIVTVERKYQDPYPMRSTARFTFGTNQLPTSKNVHDGMWRRMIVLECNRKVLVPNRDLTRPEYWHEKGQLPGMLNWAIEGLKRLRERNDLLPPMNSVGVMEEQRLLSDPTHEFITSHLQADRQGHVVKDNLYNKYSDWMFWGGNQRATLPKPQFYAAVKREFQGVEDGQIDEGGTRPRCFKGISWKT